MDKDYQETITNLVCECKLLEQQLKKKDEVIEKAIEYIKNGDLLYFANKNSVVYKENIEVVAISDRLNKLLQILEDKEE